jgi:hypothetical protein
MQDIRKKYPSYNDMSDEDLANSLHQKYYSDMDKGQFYSKIGLQPKSAARQGLENIGKDWSRFAKNLGIGVTELGRGLANTPHNVANLFGQGDKVANLVDPEFDYAQAFGMTEEPTLGDTLTRGLAQYSPSLALPGANLGRAVRAIGSFGRGGKFLQGALETAIGSLGRGGKFLQGALEQAVPQAAFGATQNENPLSGALESGAGSIGGSAIASSLEKGLNALRPSKLINTPLSKKELVREYQKAKGINADLGNLIENPRLQRRYENKLPKITNQVYKTMQDASQQISDKGNNILKKLLGNQSPENVPEQLTKSLTSQYKKHQDFKNNIYNDVDKIANDEVFKPNLAGFSNKAKEFMDAINETTLLKHEPDVRKIFNKLLGYSEPVEKKLLSGAIVNKQGQPILNTVTEKQPTLKEANILKGKLSDYAKIYAQSSSGADRNIARIFRDLSKSLKGDITNSIEKSGSNKLKETYQQAEKNYAENFSPFLDKDVYKFVSGNADPETLITKFLTNSKTSDLANKLSKLSDRLGTKQSIEGNTNRDLLAYGFLSRAVDKEGNLNPFKLSTLINNLGKNQFNTLFPNKQIRKELLDYKTLTKKNQAALNTMYNPSTGQKIADLFPHAGTQLAGALAGGMAGGPMTAIFSAIATPIARSKLASMETKKLTDPEFRRKLIKSMVADKRIKLNKEKASKAGAITAGLSGKDKEQHPMELTLTKGRK